MRFVDQFCSGWVPAGARWPVRQGLAGVLTVLACAALTGCHEEAEVALPPRPVLTQVVGEGTQVADGLTWFAAEVRSRHESPLAFRVAGKVSERRVNTGDRVQAGQVLARLDPVDLQAQTLAARAQLAAAQVDADSALRELERYRSLRQQNFIAASVLEQKQLAAQAAQARLEAARAQLTQSSNQTAYTELRADAAGVVSQLALEVGQVVAAGQPVLRLSREDQLEVAINVPEHSVARVRAQQTFPVEIAAAGSGAPLRLEGRLRELARVADPASRTYPARVSLATASGVQLGMTARVGLAAVTGDVQRIPASALFQQGQQPAVWVIGPDQMARLRPVRVERLSDDGALVAGLQAGERIAIAGVHKIVADEKVEVMSGREAPFGLDKGMAGRAGERR